MDPAGSSRMKYCLPAHSLPPADPDSPLNNSLCSLVHSPPYLNTYTPWFHYSPLVPPDCNLAPCLLIPRSC
ncbi:hypothetical protein ILYODFUR_035168 [Ilyodon furcidens]|uniref:Uncharacterized protein n=1 Tax=Ilyodon furcidens TaxID=33524 RepID=A0ABV0UQF2_9TELE